MNCPYCGCSNEENAVRCERCCAEFPKGNNNKDECEQEEKPVRVSRKKGVNKNGT